jgi:hypothetical protein
MQPVVTDSLETHSAAPKIRGVYMELVRCVLVEAAQ